MTGYEAKLWNMTKGFRNKGNKPNCVTARREEEEKKVLAELRMR